KSGMVLKRLLSMAVLSETFLSGIIIMVYVPTGPTVTFDSKMIVALNRQTRLSRSRFQNALRQSDAGRYFIAAHLFLGNVLIGMDIFFGTVGKGFTLRRIHNNLRRSLGIRLAVVLTGLYNGTLRTVFGIFLFSDDSLFGSTTHYHQSNK